MAINLPSSADVRKIRTRANNAIDAQLKLVRKPVTAWVGAGDLAVSKVNDAVSNARTKATERRAAVRTRVEKLQDQLTDAPERLTVDELRTRYTDLADRGEQTVERVRKQPRVAKVLDAVEDATDRFDTRVDKIVDEVSEAAEKLLDRVSNQTRSTGEPAAK
jgi:heparin binding hemagglutinin HbhA